MMKRSKVHKLLNALVKIIILLLSFWYIYHQLSVKEGWEESFFKLPEFLQQQEVSLWIGLVVLMMLLNWSIEALKWRYLIRKSEKITFLKALQAVWAGVTVSTFTPNRIGEYVGRVFILDQTNPWKASFMTVIGSISQFLVTVMAGSAGLILFTLRQIPWEDYVPPLLFWSLVVVIVLMNILLLVFFFNIHLLEPLLKRFTLKRWIKLREHLEVFRTYTLKELLYVLALSISRYVVFSLQLYLLFRVFGIPVPLIDGMIIISSIYLCMSAVPTIALSELGVRGSLATFFFGIYYADQYLLVDSVNTMSVLASMMIWIINLVIPALIGAVFVVRLKFFRNQ